MGRSVLARGLVLALLASSALACGDDGDDTSDGSSGDGQEGDGQGGDGDGDGSPGGDGQGGDGDACDPSGMSSGNCSEAEQAEYTSCLQSSCGDQYATAFGPNAFEGDLSGGACGSYLSCFQGCDCGEDTTCVQGCGLPSGECQTALQAVSTCATTECPSPCAEASGDGSPGGDGGSGASCEDLAGCCEALDANNKPTCDAVVNAGQDALCEQTLMTFQSGGSC